MSLDSGWLGECRCRFYTRFVRPMILPLSLMRAFSKNSFIGIWPTIDLVSRHILSWRLFKQEHRKKQMAKEVFILGGKRTPMSEYVGALKDVSAIDLGAIAARGAFEATGVKPDEIDHTIVGNALQTSGAAIYGAGHVALKPGCPFDRPALTVNRLCGSGIQSIVSGAQMIQLNEARTCLVGGME